VFNDALTHIDNLKGHVINNVHVFGRKVSRSVLRGYDKYKDNWPEGSNFASASARGRRYFKIDIFAPEFALPISTHARANFLSGSQEFYKKNGDMGKMLANDIQFARKVSPLGIRYHLCSA